MWAKQKNTSLRTTNRHEGFTIVELLIVIVVIAILAAITIVAYNGIQDRAKTSKAASALTQASKKLKLWQVDNADQYPATLAEAGISNTADTSYQYSSNNSTSPATYCISATTANSSYYLSSSSSTVQSGICPGHNMLVWDESAASMPVPSATYDTTTYRSATASMRLGPSQVGRTLSGNPYSGTAGQIYTVTLWILTDATWNGTAGNSKIRFGNASDGALLHACGYNGVKTSWTQVSCSFTLTPTVTSVSISVGNDGTTGNIWIDDLTVSRT
jgi:prepilin-type N-terminal cleavage/methylation domain-containing protein